MAQLLISAAGAAIGFAIGGPMGAQIGWGVGGLIGSSMGAGSVDGPRLTDTKVQISSYGAALPRTWGGVRVAGNVIWALPLTETASEQGGKGGPSVTTYSYAGTFAVAIAEGVVPGVRRIWADTKLVYDIRPDATPEAQAESAVFGQFFVFYSGSEDQLPDPTIEAAKGVGEVPAYRGTAYVVFTDLPLADYGNRIPNFSFELSAEPAESDVLDLQPLRIYPWALSGDGRPVHSYGNTWYGGGTSQTDYAAGLAAAQAASDLDEIELSDTYIGFSTSTNPKPDLYTDGADLNDDPQVVFAWHARRQPDVINDAAPGGTAVCDELVSAGAEYQDGLAYFVHTSWDPEGIQRLAMYTLGQGGEGDWPGIANYCPGLGPAGSPATAGASYMIQLGQEREPAVPPDTCGPGDPGILGIAELPGNPLFCLRITGEVVPKFTYTKVTGTYKQLSGIVYRDGVLYQNGLGPVLALGDEHYDDEAWWAAQRDAAITAGTLQADVPSPQAETVVAAAQALPEAVAEEASALLSDIVTDICLECGLQEAQIDVTQLTDTVLGYIRARQMSGRQALEALRQAYWFDAVESGGIIKFVKRGGAVMATIGLDDLGAAEGAESTEPIVHARAQETELPAVVAVAYSARTADYQTGTQRSRRTTTGSQQATTVELPIVLTDERAAQVADVLLYDGWISRMQRTVTTTRRWTALEPTDPLLLDDGVRQYRVRCIDKVESGPVITLKCVDEDVSSYSPNVVAIPTPGGGGVITLVSPMRLELMDLPILRDADNASGYYAAGAGYTATWPGGRVFRSTDGATYTPVLDITQRATLGIATTALAAWSGGNVVDERNTVTVQLLTGELASITRAELLANGNAALLGDEVLQFQRAELVSAGTYRLSGLLRGRRGTEHLTGGHAVNERFVLLSAANVYRVAESVSQIGVPAQFKGATFGQALADVPAQPFTDTGEALRPFSVVHVRASRADDGSARFTWMRRTRLATRLAGPLGITAPLGEASEAYEVDVWADATRAAVVRTLATSTTQVDYTPAQQVEDFGAVQTEFWITVYQLSATYGRGLGVEAGFGAGGDGPALPTLAVRAHYYNAAPAAITSYIDTQTDGAILYKGMLPVGLGEPNAFLVDNGNVTYSLNTSGAGWMVRGGSVETVQVTDTGVTFLSTPGSNWYTPFGNVMVFLAGAGIFERITWTGDGSGARAVPHNVGTAPALVMAVRNAVEDWWLYSSVAGAGQAARFPSTSGHGFGAEADAFPSLSTDTALEVGPDLNAAGQQYLALIWSGDSASVDTGTYTGNGSSTGPTVSLGFSPALLLIRCTDATLAHTFVTTDVLAGRAQTHWFIDDRGMSPATSAIVTLSGAGFAVVSAADAVNKSGSVYQYWALRP